MSKAINCLSCGAANIYNDEASSVTCDFCGAMITIPVLKSSAAKVDQNSRLKSKPEISKPREKKDSSPPNFAGQIRVVRVDNGWICHFKNRPSKFVQDKIVFDYSNGGGELIVTRKGLTSIEELFDWYSDTELQSIRELNLENNELSGGYNISHLLNLEMLNLRNNKISDTTFQIASKKVRKINLSNNSISEVNFTSLFKASSLNLTNRIKLDLSRNKISELLSTEIEFCIIKGLLLDIDLSENPADVTSVLKKINNKYKDGSVDLLAKIDYGPLTRMKSGNYNNLKAFENSVIYEMNIIDSKGNRQSFKFKTGNLKQIKDAYLKKYGQQFKGKKSGACFIATAAMGSYDHPQVMELRHFRDEWILAKAWGESFVKWYYHYGEIVAKFIEKSFVLKKLSYLLIVKPLVYLSRIVNTK